MQEGGGPLSSSPHPPPPPSESLARRYNKVVWRTLLISNIALGVYMLARAKKKDTAAENRKTRTKEPPAPVAAAATSIPQEPLLYPESPPVIEPVKAREPIPEDQQRELFKWILEEKRKVKPKDREEKKRIDEEKALLKEFIHAKSIPRI